MGALSLWISVLLVGLVFSRDNIETVNLLEVGKYEWKGTSNDKLVNVTADGYTITATIETCDIGNKDARPNTEYLTLKQGHPGGNSKEKGRIFAYIKNQKRIFSFSDSVVLQLNTPDEQFQKECTVIFETGAQQDPIPPPLTTTEQTPTVAPGISKYSTVFLTGKSIDDFNKDGTLLDVLRGKLADMAINYTAEEGFCLKKPIKAEDVEINVLEQCPTKWQDYENCVRLVYALPVLVNDICSLWKGYQLTQEHLEVMFARLGDSFFNDNLKVYKEPSVDGVVTWWITAIIFVTLAFVSATIALNLVWKRRQILKRARDLQNEDFIPELRKVSEMSLTPPYFQSIPPMFEKAFGTHPGDQGNDNEGFQYDELPVNEEDTTA